jgi:hypothetical protein
VTRLLWAFAWVGVAIWSLFCWAAYGMVDLFGGLAARNADAITSHPETVEWLFWTFDVLRRLGLTTIVGIWGLVSLAMLAVPWLLARVGRRSVEPTRAPHVQSSPRSGVLDLAPDQYSVGSTHADPAPHTPTQRLERR